MHLQSVRLTKPDANHAIMDQAGSMIAAKVHNKQQFAWTVAAHFDKLFVNACTSTTGRAGVSARAVRLTTCQWIWQMF